MPDVFLAAISLLSLMASGMHIVNLVITRISNPKYYPQVMKKNFLSVVSYLFIFFMTLGAVSWAYSQREYQYKDTKDGQVVVFGGKHFCYCNNKWHTVTVPKDQEFNIKIKSLKSSWAGIIYLVSDERPVALLKEKANEEKE